MAGPDDLKTRLTEILNTTFTDKALTQFCFDQFPAVYRRFSTDMGKRQKISSLVTYCEEKGQLDQLRLHHGAQQPAAEVPTRTVPTQTQPAAAQVARLAPSQRCLDLADHIREAQSLLKEYEAQRRLSSDPKEQARADREIAELRRQLAEYEAEVNQLGCP
jgi:hypothetical protein